MISKHQRLMFFKCCSLDINVPIIAHCHLPHSARTTIHRQSIHRRVPAVGLVQSHRCHHSCQPSPARLFQSEKFERLSRLHVDGGDATWKYVVQLLQMLGDVLVVPTVDEMSKLRTIEKCYGSWLVPSRRKGQVAFS